MAISVEAIADGNFEIVTLRCTGLSYYYLAPNMRITGDFTLGNRTRRIDGVAWFEHQWGNYRSNDEDNTHYAW